jgi:hypothetical protein
MVLVPQWCLNVMEITPTINAAVVSCGNFRSLTEATKLEAWSLHVMAVQMISSQSGWDSIPRSLTLEFRFETV